MRTILSLMIGLVLIAGCDDDHTTGPRSIPPAAPRGLHSTTGDHQVLLTWLPNTERNITYRIYIGDCGGVGCPYDPIGASSTASFVVTGLANGQTRYFAVSAVNSEGRESELSYDTVFDTPRPEGTGLVLSSYLADSAHAGLEFSTLTVRSYTSALIDVFYGTSGIQPLMYAPFSDTEIQDAGYASSLDAVDFAPTAGWSPTGTVELIAGHCYLVWTRDDHFAKFRVTSVTSSRVVIDWAYQVDPGNRELNAHAPVSAAAQRVRRAAAWAAVRAPGGA
jgi:hypothetical protein